MLNRTYLSLLAATLTAVAFSASPADAQRDAGAKLRGDTGRYSGRTTAPTPRVIAPRPGYVAQPGISARAGVVTQPGGSIAVQPQGSVETEAYSLVPLPFEVGDTVEVVADSALLMRGRNAVAPVPTGDQLRVLRIRGPWIGVAADIDGRQVGGWLWYSQVAPSSPGETTR